MPSRGLTRMDTSNPWAGGDCRRRVPFLRRFFTTTHQHISSIYGFKLQSAPVVFSHAHRELNSIDHVNLYVLLFIN
jgi:hypothetical protein